MVAKGERVGGGMDWEVGRDSEGSGERPLHLAPYAQVKLDDAQRKRKKRFCCLPSATRVACPQKELLFDSGTPE